jgi:DNA-binding NarL/FixJ family response regulator
LSPSDDPRMRRRGAVAGSVRAAKPPEFERDPAPTLVLPVVPDASGDDTITVEGLVITGTYAVVSGEPDPGYVYHLDAVAGRTDGRLDAGARPLADEVPASSPAPIRVVLAHREPLLLRGIAGLLAEESGFDVVGEAHSGDEAVELVLQHEPDIVILDAELPDREGLEVVEELKRHRATARTVLLARQITEQRFLRARSLGVQGVVLTTMPPRLLVQCLRTVHAGDEFLEKGALIKALKTLMRQSTAGLPGKELTEREREVAELVAAGLSNQQIAERLGVGSGTVKSHLHTIYDKLGVHSRYALMRLGASGS